MKKTTIHVVSAISSVVDENSYIIYLEGSQECVVVDPGVDTDALLRRLDEKRLTPVAIFITHGHYDHIGGIPVLKKRWNHCVIVSSEAESEKFSDPQLNLSSMFEYPAAVPKADRFVEDGEEFSYAGIRFRALHIPGHSAGHMVYVILDTQPQEVFVGDTVFKNSIGRGDFPDGNLLQLVNRIKEKILTLPDDTVLHCGHGSSTTVLKEKTTNPYLK